MRSVIIMLAVSLPLTACTHHPKEHVPKITKTESNVLPSEAERLMWRCPAVAFERLNSNGTIDSWGVCAVEVGGVDVRQNRGAIIPLGKLISSEDIAPRIINGYTLGETYQSGPIKYVKYAVLHDASKVRVGYEVLFPDCTADNFTLYIEGQNEDGALEALDYVLNKMKIGSYCHLN